MNGLASQSPCHSIRPEAPRPPTALCSTDRAVCIEISLHTCFLPSQPSALLASPKAPANHAAGHPGCILQSVASFHRPGLHHYYGFICHPAPLRSRLGSPLARDLPFPDGTGLPRFIVRIPVRFTDLNHRTGLTEYRASYTFGRLTRLNCRIRFAYAPVTSLPIASFRPCRCQQRPCESDCLPFGPGDPRFLQRGGLSGFAGQTKGPLLLFSEAAQKNTLSRHECEVGALAGSLVFLNGQGEKVF